MHGLTLIAAVERGLFTEFWNPFTVGFFAVFAAWILTVIGFVWAYVVLFRRRVGLLTTVVSRAEEERDHVDRHELRMLARQDDAKGVRGTRVVATLWDEFDETLVTSSDGTITRNTVDAAYFFTFDSMARELSRNRLLAATPGMLAAAGVLGTFITLAIGLGGLDFNGSSTALGNGVQNMIGAAGFAFWKSVAGVSASLAFTLGLRIIDTRATSTMAALQQRIDTVFVRVIPERSLVKIADSTKSSQDLLASLGEQIGTRLQETVQVVSTSISTAVTEAITTAMAPSMTALAENTSQQSEEALGALVNRFATSFTELGDRQRTLMDEASTRLTTSIDAMSVSFTDVVTQAQRFIEETTRRQEEILRSLESTDTALRESSAHLDTSATALGTASTAFEATTSRLSEGLIRAAETLQSLFDHSSEQVAHLEELRSNMQAAGDAVNNGAGRLANATEQFTDHLEVLTGEHERFERAIRTEMDTAVQALRENVAAMAQQIGEWLGTYGRDVEKQIESRMLAWNAHSKDYASMMLSTAQAMGQVLDEIRTASEKEVQGTSEFREVEAAS